MTKKKAWIALFMAIFIWGFIPLAFGADNVPVININTADAETLTQLKRVGSKYAQAIIQYREENGPFEKAEDLTLVPGIGEKTLELNKDRIVVSEEQKP